MERLREIDNYMRYSHIIDFQEKLTKEFSEELRSIWTIKKPENIFQDLHMGDLVVTRGTFPMVTVRIVPLLINSELDKIYADYYTSSLRDDIYVAISDGTQLYYKQHFISEKNEWQKISFANFVKILVETPISTIEKDTVYKLLKLVFENHSFAKEKNISIEASDLVFDTNKYIVSLTEKKENELLNLIIPSLTKTSLQATITRFTSIETLFAILINNSIRMYSAESMNDKEDCDFLWKDLYGSMSKEPRCPLCAPIYLMSCSLAEDTDLTMWRLYGDDTRGVCLKYNVPTKKMAGGFYLSRIVYSDDTKYDFIKAIVGSTLKFGMPLMLNKWNIWSAFFKDKEYKIEQEVRLLYVFEMDSCSRQPSDKGWVMSKANNIANRYVDFQITPTAPFPLQMTDVYIGANNDEQEVNIKQFQQLIDDSIGFKSHNIHVRPAESTSYRPTKK
ncbi:MAG: DUF2971 domain-containing protein [Paludibacteraceae bacterium]|nr:DUF2971 domain-containing protein [Paludibacteraceae bacterium]